MAVPTLAQIKAAADNWWQTTTKPRLDDLTAIIAAMFTNPRACVRLRIVNNSGIYSLIAELEITESFPGAGDGQLVQRTWTPTNGVRQQDLADVYDPARGRTMREDGAA